MTIENHDDYMELVQEIARNAVIAGENPRTAAEHAIVDWELLSGEGIVLRYSPEPFVDDPSSTTRLWPSDVLTNDDRYPYPKEWAANRGGLRSIAVMSLKEDINHVLEGFIGGYEEYARGEDDAGESPMSFEEWVEAEG